MNRSVRWGAAFSMVALGLSACAGGDGSPPGSTQPEFSQSEGELTGFDPNDVLSDADFTNTSSMTAAQIQTFLADTSCYCGFKGASSALATYSSNGKTAAQAISDAATANGINPVEFLARVQVERSMLCKQPSQHALDFAFSYGCPDNHPQCYDQYKGFDVQVEDAGKGFAGYLSQIKSTGSAYGWGPGKPHKTLDPLTVTPVNAATAALYAYTPWVGTGNAGNSLHFLVWKKLTKCLGLSSAPPSLSTKPKPKPTLSCSQAQAECSKDEQCNHGAQHTGYVCADSPPEKGQCIDGCHEDADCPAGETCDVTAQPHFQCTGPVPPVGTTCKTDADCKDGADVPRVCSANTGKCIVGCHSDADCGDGKLSTTAVCDMGQKTYVCVSRKEIGDTCASDVECSGGVHGTQRVCNGGFCDDACHTDSDCDDESICSHKTMPWTCDFQGHAHSDDSCKSMNPGCPAITYPSGVKIQTKTDAALEASYQGHLKTGQAAPHCFVDLDDLRNPDTNEKYDYEKVMVSDHFSLYELTHTEKPYGHRVVLDEKAVEELEKFRQELGEAITVTSGYRSPLHQTSVCEQYCSDIQCCIHPGNFYGTCDAGHSSVSCSRYSRHMFGRAFDLPPTYLSAANETKAKDAGFGFAFNEVNHLHVGDD